MESKKADNMMNQQDDVPGGEKEKGKEKRKRVQSGLQCNLEKREVL